MFVGRKSAGCTVLIPPLVKEPRLKSPYLPASTRSLSARLFAGAVLPAALLISVASVGGCASNKVATPVVAPLSAGAFSRVWSSDVSKDISDRGDRATGLYLSDKNLFLITRQNYSYVFDRASGSLLNVHQIIEGDVQVLPPIVSGDRWIYPTLSTLEIFDTNGVKKNSVHLAATVRTPGTTAGPRKLYLTLAFPAGGRLALVELDRPYDTGSVWELQTLGDIRAQPVVYDGIVYVASGDGRIYAVDGNRNGVWKIDDGTFHSGGPVLADLAVDDYGLYVAGTDTKLICLGRKTGKIRWQYYASTPLMTGPYVDADTVYQAVPGTGLVAISKTDGAFNRKPLWTASDVGRVIASDGKYLIIETVKGDIASLDRKTGKLVEQAVASAYALKAVNMTDRNVFAATPSGKVVAVKAVQTPGTVGEQVFPK
jgi:PQQ-like domain